MVRPPPSPSINAAECSLTCVPLGPSPPATTRGATAPAGATARASAGGATTAGVRRAWSSEWAGGGDGRGRSAARAGRRKRARRLCLRQVRIGVVRVRATLGTAALGTQGVWHGKGPSPFQGPALVLPRARLTCARRPLPSLPKAGRAPRRRAICSSHRLARAARQARVRPIWSRARTCGSSWFLREGKPEACERPERGGGWPWPRLTRPRHRLTRRGRGKRAPAPLVPRAMLLHPSVQTIAPCGHEQRVQREQLRAPRLRAAQRVDAQLAPLGVVHQRGRPRDAAPGSGGTAQALGRDV